MEREINDLENKAIRYEQGIEYDKITIEYHYESTIDIVIELFAHALEVAGYSKDNIVEFIKIPEE